MGLARSFYDGLQDVTIPWAATESDDRVLLSLAEHFARHAGESPSYRDEALALFNRGAAFRERVRLGAEGTTLYAEVRSSADRSPGLFDDETDVEPTEDGEPAEETEPTADTEPAASDSSSANP